MKFDILDKFIEQKAAGNRASEELNRKIQQADEEYQALKARYESKLKDSLLSGKDETKALDQLSDQIESAKKACKRRREERDIYSASKPFEVIKAQDVVDAWNKEFLLAFKAEKFDPVAKRLLDTKKAYVEAALEYFAVIDEFEDERRVTRSELSDTYYYRLNDVKFITQAEIDKYFITENDLRTLEYKEMPASIKGVK